MNGLDGNTRLRRPSMDTTISTTVGTGDVNKKINWIYFLLGSAMLLPWNAMITAIPFFLERMANSSLRTTFSSYFSAIYQLSSFFALAHASYTAASASKPRRITVSHIVLTATLLLLFLSTFVPSSPTLFFIFALAVGSCQAIAGTYLLTSVVAYAAYFGPDSMQSIMSGQAAVAVVVSIVQLITTMATLGRKGMPNQGENSADIVTTGLLLKKLATALEARSGVSTSASYFFFTATLGLLASYIGYRRLTRMKTFKSTVARFEASNAEDIDAEYAVLPTNDDRSNADTDDVDEDDMLALSTSFSSLRESEPGTSTSITRENTIDSVNSVKTLEEIEPIRNDVNFLRVWKVNALYNIAVMWIYIVTLAFFPSITSSVSTVNPNIFTSPAIFMSLHFLIFNVSDWTGRYICSYPRFQIWSRKRLLAYSIARSFFSLLFLGCNVNLGGVKPKGLTAALVMQKLSFGRFQDVSSMVTDTIATPLINSDILYFILLIIFGVSNGWLTSLIMMAAPSLEHNKRMRKEWVDVAAVGSSFSLAAGLVLGSIANFIIRGVTCDCNPFTQ